MNALSDLVKYAQVGDVRYIRGDKDQLYSRRSQAAIELAAMEAVIKAARLQNDTWHSPLVSSALAKLDELKG